MTSECFQFHSSLKINPDSNEFIQEVVNKIKSQGLFDKFRKQCLNDVESNNLFKLIQQNVESFTENFLSEQTWSGTQSEKTELRENLRNRVKNTSMITRDIDSLLNELLKDHCLNKNIMQEINLSILSQLGTVDAEAYLEGLNNGKIDAELLEAQATKMELEPLESLPVEDFIEEKCNDSFKNVKIPNPLQFNILGPAPSMLIPCSMLNIPIQFIPAIPPPIFSPLPPIPGFPVPPSNQFFPLSAPIPPPIPPPPCNLPKAEPIFEADLPIKSDHQSIDYCKKDSIKDKIKIENGKDETSNTVDLINSPKINPPKSAELAFCPPIHTLGSLISKKQKSTLVGNQLVTTRKIDTLLMSRHPAFCDNEDDETDSSTDSASSTQSSETNTFSSYDSPSKASKISHFQKQSKRDAGSKLSSQKSHRNYDHRNSHNSNRVEKFNSSNEKNSAHRHSMNSRDSHDRPDRHQNDKHKRHMDHEHNSKYHNSFKRHRKNDSSDEDDYHNHVEKKHDINRIKARLKLLDEKISRVSEKSRSSKNKKSSRHRPSDK